ncbi:MAG: glycosyltransferase family 2 protein [Candidatus Micrarchaeota archaeon]|nr:glycosyltransferase family 2 protein [Candidatus Micrarchaeota archaeon]
MKLRKYDAEKARVEGATALPGFERSGFEQSGRKQLIVIGAALLTVAILVSMLVSYSVLLLAYSIFIIFILLIYLVIWTDGAADMPEPDGSYYKKWPTVTLVIPSYNSRHTIFECIKACQAIRYPNKVEILVVDDGSTDGSTEQIAKIKGIRLLRKEKNAGKGAALNMAIRQAKGEIIGCVDSDTYASPDTLIRAVPQFVEDEKTGAVVLFINAAAPSNLLQRIQELEYWVSFGFYFKTVAFISALHVTPGPMALYRRAVFEQLGGFDEHNIAEDMEIALRMHRHGWKVKTCHGAPVYTEVPATWKSLYRQRLRWFRGGLHNVFKYSDMFLNPRYGSLGLFVLPMVLASGLFAALFVFWTALDMGRNLFNWVMPWVANYAAVLPIALRLPPLDPLMFSSALIVGVIPAIIWAFFLYSGFSISHQKMKLEHVFPALVLMFLYPFFLGYAFLMAYVYELSGKSYKW